jgi:hypothetical protein
MFTIASEDILAVWLVDQFRKLLQVPVLEYFMYPA